MRAEYGGSCAGADIRRFSVVIPAYDEEKVIGRCLRTIMSDALPGEVEIVVVCNGCRDGTATAARRACPSATVLELPAPGKTAALNAGDAVTKSFPRFYIDADVEVSAGSLRTVVKAMEEARVLCGAPRPAFVVEGRPWIIRSFYQVWERLPYLNEETVGSGVYGLTEEGRARFGAFPDLTADDQFVLQQFSIAERLSVQATSFTVHTPTHLSGLLRMRRRVYRGNRELERSGMLRYPSAKSGLRTLVGLASSPRWAARVVAYIGVNLLAMIASRVFTRHGSWERDTSAREQDVASGGIRVGYIASRYPAVSHTFVLREVLAVREAGVDVSTFAVRRSEPSQLLTGVDREEDANTWSVRPVSLVRVVREHLVTLISHPAAWFRTLCVAVLNSPPGMRAVAWQLFYFAEAVLLWRECERRGVRHLHAHMANVAADLAWLACCMGRSARPSSGWCWTLRMHGSAEFSEIRAHNLAAKVEAADLVICVSDFTRSQLMALSTPPAWQKLVVVHTGTDLDCYRPVLRSRGPREAVEILTVGRLHPVKGHPLLIEAVAVLRERGLPVRLTVVGDGPMRQYLCDLAAELDVEDAIYMAGTVGQDTMAGYYAAADIFCLTSFAEGVPVVLMEAMACGLPIVSSRITGIPELVDDGVSGLLVTPGRVDLLADALAVLVEDSALRHRMGKAGRRKVELEFDAWTNGRQVAACLASVQGRDLARCRVPQVSGF